MMNRPAAPRSAPHARAYLPWLMGLAWCVRTATAEAQPERWQARRQESTGCRNVPHEAPTDAEDPDLVRAGVHPTLEGALAAGATAAHAGSADFDGDGRVDRMLVVTPRRDPYPYNHAPGLVLARAVVGGWRAAVVARDWQPWRTRAGADVDFRWMPPVVGRRGALLVVDDRRRVEEASLGYDEHHVSFVRVDRDGALWYVGGDRWTEGVMHEEVCSPRRYRFAGAWSVRGDARECRPIQLEPRL